MVYRHIYWGLLPVRKGPGNSLTGALKPSYYLVKVVSPIVYESRETALEDQMEYCFVAQDEEPYLFGYEETQDEEREEGKNKDRKPFTDQIFQSDWSRYRIIRLGGKKKRKGKKETPKIGLPTAKAWKKLFPAYGCYPLIKVAYSIIGLPEVEAKKEKDHADTGK